jgi:hypothetical protein
MKHNQNNKVRGIGKSFLIFILLFFISFSLVDAKLGVYNPDDIKLGNSLQVGTGTGGDTFITNNYINQTNNITTYIVNQTNITTINNITNNITNYYNTTELDTLALASISNQNSSWLNIFNVTYATWAYNQTTPFTNWLSSFLYNYNQTVPNNNTIFNITYQNFAYNHSSVTNNSIVNTYSFWWYNHTSASNSSIVNTYGKWFYNMSDGTGSGAVTNGTILSILNITNFFYNYNQTVPNNNTIFNITYQTYAYNQSSVFSYNHTQASNSSIVGTYGKWFYNMSDGSYNLSYVTQNASNHVVAKIFCGNITGGSDADFCADATGGGGAVNDGITIKYQNITNVPSCSAGQVLTNLTGGLSCVTPTANVVRNIYSLNNGGLSNLNTTSSTIGRELFIMPIVANTNYTIDCYMQVSSNVTTTGVQLNLTFPAIPEWVQASYTHPTTATAMAFSNCNGRLKQCMDLSATSTLVASPSKVELHAFIMGNTTTGGNMNMSFKSEVNTSPALVHRGSYCEVKST